MITLMIIPKRELKFKKRKLPFAVSNVPNIKLRLSDKKLNISH
jgi:hypothetical protein